MVSTYLVHLVIVLGVILVHLFLFREFKIPGLGWVENGVMMGAGRALT